MALGDPPALETTQRVDYRRWAESAAFLDVFPNAPTVNLVEPKIGRNWGETQSLTKWLDG